MREGLLIIAGAISLVGLYFHMFRGVRMIVHPVLASELHHVPKHTLEFSWYWGSVTMSILTFCYLAPIFREDFIPLAMLATVYSYWLGAISFIIMRKQRFRISQMPQWIIFWTASGFGLASWGLA